MENVTLETPYGLAVLRLAEYQHNFRPDVDSTGYYTKEHVIDADLASREACNKLEGYTTNEVTINRKTYKGIKFKVYFTRYAKGEEVEPYLCVWASRYNTYNEALTDAARAKIEAALLPIIAPVFDSLLAALKVQYRESYIKSHLESLERIIATAQAHKAYLLGKV